MHIKLKSNTCSIAAPCISIYYLFQVLICTPQTIQWQNTIGGNFNDELSSIEQTHDGGYILGGTSGSDISGDKTEIGHGYWVVKLDSAGNIQWQNTIWGDGPEYLYSIRQTDDKGYILGGLSWSYISGDKTENAKGWDDYWVVKLDSSGNIQWQNTIGGSLSDELHSIEQTHDGGYILGGSSKSNISGDKTENSQGLEDYWVIKLDSAGNIQWQNTIGGDGVDELYSIQQTDDKGYILGGFSNSDASGDKTEDAMEYDYWVVKLDSSGNIQWQNTIGGDNYDKLYSIQQTDDKGYILGGSSNSDASGDKTENTIGLGWWDDYWVVKLDSSGNMQWQNTIGGDGVDELYSIRQTNDKGYILGGTSGSDISGDKTEIGYGYWVVKLDSAGNIQWQSTIWGDNIDELRSIEQTHDGGYILGGFSRSDISGDKTENSQGVDDYWVVKLFPVNGINENTYILKNLSVHPNPSTGRFTVEWRGSGIGELSIRNLFGQEVYKRQITAGSTAIDLGRQAAGMYFLSLRTRKGSFINKLLIR